MHNLFELYILGRWLDGAKVSFTIDTDHISTWHGNVNLYIKKQLIIYYDKSTVRLLGQYRLGDIYTGGLMNRFAFWKTNEFEKSGAMGI